MLSINKFNYIDLDFNLINLMLILNLLIFASIFKKDI